MAQNSTFTQAQSNHKYLAAYFLAMNSFVTDDTGATLPPDCSETLVSLLNMADLVTMTQARADDTASFQNGAAIESVHNVVSVVREFELRSKTKLAYYSDASADYMNDSNYWSTISAYYNNILSGNLSGGQPT